MKIKKLLGSLSVALIISGCTTMNDVQEVKVPVYVTPKPPQIESPELPINQIDVSDITTGNVAGILVKKYVISLRLSLNYIDLLENIISTYDQLSNMPVDHVELSPRESRVLTSEEANQQDFEAFAQSRFNQLIEQYEKEKQVILNDIQ